MTRNHNKYGYNPPAQRKEVLVNGERFVVQANSDEEAAKLALRQRRIDAPDGTITYDEILIRDLGDDE